LARLLGSANKLGAKLRGHPLEASVNVLGSFAAGLAATSAGLGLALL
jgi:hypothetical protein